MASASSPTIHGCYSKRTGALRIASRCKRSERAIEWSKTGPRGPRGLAGTNGAPGTARAYAYVNGSISTPSFNAARTKGFTAVTEPASGIYCLTAPGIDPATTAPALTIVYYSGFANEPTAVRLDPSTSCSASQFQVETDGITSGPDENPAPHLDFTIVVP